MKKHSLNLLWMLAIVLGFAACGDDDKGGSYSPEVIDNPVTGVTISGITAEGLILPDVGSAATVTLALTPDNGSDKDRYSFDYISGDTKVFTVDNAGHVTATGAGTALLTVKANNNAEVKASCKVTVVGVKVASISLPADLTITHPAEAYKALSNEISVLPDNASLKRVTYTSSNTAVATVDEAGNVWPVWEGSTKITATALDGSGASATCNVTVNITPISAVTFNTWNVNSVNGAIASGSTNGTIHINTNRNLLSSTEFNPDITVTKTTGGTTNRIRYTPATPSLSTLNYTSSNPTAVVVESNASNNALVIKPQATPGTAVISIDAADGKGAHAELTVVNHAVLDRAGWSIVDASPNGKNWQGDGGPAANVISDEDVVAAFRKADAFVDDSLKLGISESYFVVDLGKVTKFDYMLTEAVWAAADQTSQRPRQIQLYGSNEYPAQTWTDLQGVINVSHNSYYKVPKLLNEVYEYRYVKVVLWSNTATQPTQTSYNSWLIKNFWLATSE